MQKVNPNYISLQEATKFCSYSQKYLNLRVRQSKLRAVKIGRNWVTTKEWINEYIKTFANGNGNHNDHKNTEEKKATPLVLKSKVDFIRKPSLVLLFMAVFISLTSSIFFNAKEITTTFLFTRNYIEIAINYAEKIINSAESFSRKSLINSADNFSQVFSESTNLVASTGIIFMEEYKRGIAETLVGVRESTINLYNNFSYNASNAFSQMSLSIIESDQNKILEDKRQITAIFVEIPITIRDYRDWINQGFVERVGLAKGVFLKISHVATKKVEDLALNIMDGIFRKSNFRQPNFLKKILSVADYIANNTHKVTKNIADTFVNNKVVLEKKTVSDKKKNEGLVVVPSTKQNEENLRKIEKSFSDEVIVEMKNDNTGIIRPVFKNDNSQEYLYLLVPIKQTN